MSIANSSHVRVMKSVLEVHSVHAGSLELVVDDGLGTGLDTGNVVSEGIHATLCGIDFDNVDKLLLTTLELLLPEDAVWFALIDHERLGIFTISEHLVDEIGLRYMGSKPGLVDIPTRRENFGNCSDDSVMSHCFFSY